MKNKKTHIWIALGTIAVFLFIAFFGCGSDIKGIRHMRFGIDIKGGVEAVFEPVGITKKPTAKELESARNIIEERLDSRNILDREVTIEKQEGRILVRFPWKSDEKDFNPEEAIAELDLSLYSLCAPVRCHTECGKRHEAGYTVYRRRDPEIYMHRRCGYGKTQGDCISYLMKR